MEPGQFRARDTRELTQGCVARVIQGAGRRCADLGKLIEGCRHAERLGQRFRTQPGDGRRSPPTGFMSAPAASRRCSDRCNCAGPRRSRTYSGQSGPKECSDSTSNPRCAYQPTLARASATCKIGARPSIVPPSSPESLTWYAGLASPAGRGGPGGGRSFFLAGVVPGGGEHGQERADLESLLGGMAE
jgi:hypothetical protein